MACCHGCQFSAQDSVVKYKEQLSNVSETKSLLDIIPESRPLILQDRGYEVYLWCGTDFQKAGKFHLIPSDMSRVWYPDGGLHFTTVFRESSSLQILNLCIHAFELMKEQSNTISSNLKADHILTFPCHST